MTEDKDKHIIIRVPLDAPNVTRVSDRLIIVDIGTAEEVMLMITHAIGNPGMGVMMKKEGEE